MACQKQFDFTILHLQNRSPRISHSQFFFLRQVSSLAFGRMAISLASAITSSNAAILKFRIMKKGPISALSSPELCEFSAQILGPNLYKLATYEPINHP